MNFYFNDFSFDLKDFDIIRAGQKIGETKGLSNEENGKAVLHLFPDAPVENGDILRQHSSEEEFHVSRVIQDSFETAQFLTVHYS